MKRHLIWFSLLAVCMVACKTHTTRLGSPATPLQIAQWVKGTPVDLQQGQGTNIYVIEFWATWCPPCLETIPHLTELQKKFASANVVVVGITDEDIETVKPFVARLGERMNYTVAIDDQEKTWRSYMNAFGQELIPHAFVVDRQGSIVWHGFPLDGLEEALEKVAGGSRRNLAPPTP